MVTHPMTGIGPRIATARRARGLSQQEFADAAGVSYATVRSVERGARYPSEASLDAMAAALGIDPSRLVTSGARTTTRLDAAMPALSAVLASYDVPVDGPVRPVSELRLAVSTVQQWRLEAQYVRLAEAVPSLLAELARAFHHSASGGDRAIMARLLVSAYRSADAVAYKGGHRDLSARLIELMRWANGEAQDEVLAAITAYVRTEVFFAAKAHDAGLIALERALDVAPTATTTSSTAARGSLHMRAAVIAARTESPDRGDEHLTEARRLADQVTEGIYAGTAFGPDSVRVHELSYAVSLGDRGVQRALEIAREWAPPRNLPSERRSGFYIELSRAQLWAGRRAEAFESLRLARQIAPQHTREHRWAREVTETLLRLSRSDRDGLTRFADWIGAT